MPEVECAGGDDQLDQVDAPYASGVFSKPCCGAPHALEIGGAKAHPRTPTRNDRFRASAVRRASGLDLYGDQHLAVQQAQVELCLARDESCSELAPALAPEGFGDQPLSQKAEGAWIKPRLAQRLFRG